MIFYASKLGILRACDVFVFVIIAVLVRVRRCRCWRADLGKLQMTLTGSLFQTETALFVCFSFRV